MKKLYIYAMLLLLSSCISENKLRVKVGQVWSYQGHTFTVTRADGTTATLTLNNGIYSIPWEETNENLVNNYTLIRE